MLRSYCTLHLAKAMWNNLALHNVPFSPEILTENFIKLGLQHILINKSYFCKYLAYCAQIPFSPEILTENWAKILVSDRLCSNVVWWTTFDMLLHLYWTCRSLFRKTWKWMGRDNNCTLSCKGVWDRSIL